MHSFLLDLGLKFQNTNVLMKFIITIILFAALHFIKRSLCSFIDKINLSSKQTIKYKKITSVFFKILFIFIVIPLWMYESKDILTFLGLFSAGLAFAFRDVVANFLGWIIINTQKPFQVGDRIKISESVGDVLEIDWFYTTIIEVMESDNKTYGQSTGRLIYIPNIKLLNEQLINETNSFPFTWHELEIALTTDSNWEKAKEIILNIADEIVGNVEQEAKDSLNIASKNLPIYYENLSHTIYTSLENGKIILTLRFICKARNFRNLKHYIIENVLKEFLKHEDINLYLN
ncbi:mechanosensitive ion channel family protein [Clostridium sp. JNZ J1-5]